MSAVVISNSRRGRVTGCRYRFYLENVLGLRREEVEEPLRVGTLWHEFMHKGLLSSDWDAAMMEVLGAQKVQEDESISTLLLGMAKTAKPQIVQFLNDYDVIAVEVPFYLRISKKPRKVDEFLLSVVERPTLEMLQKEKRNVLYYTGQMDAVLRHKPTGNLWVMEHKTTSIMDQSRFESNMEASFQVYGYVLAATLMYSGMVCGVIFDVARKKVPTIPKLNQCKWCKGTGEIQVKQKGDKGAEPIREVCFVCEGSGKGQFSGVTIETTEAVLDEALKNATHLRKEEYKEYLEGAYQEWRSECLRTSRPFWYTYPKAVRYEQLKEWLVDTWEVGRLYKALKKKKSEREFCRHLDAMQCLRCPFRPLCLDGTDWDRDSVPPGYVKFEEPLIPAEVNVTASKEGVAESDDFIGF